MNIRLKRSNVSADYFGLYYAIIEQAVEDYKFIKQVGMIKDGKCVKQWPCKHGKRIKIMGDYSACAHVNSLLYFLTHEMPVMLEELDSKIDTNASLKKLGIELLN